MAIKTTVNTVYRLPFTQGKAIEVPYREAVEEALSHYPELANVPIVFTENPGITPIKCRPALGSLLGFRKKRFYQISISNESIGELEPVLIMNLNHEARVGLLGQGLAKIVAYQHFSNWTLLKHFLQRPFHQYKKQFERKADLTTVRHGLGWQLYEWARIRKKAETGNPVLQRYNEFHLDPEDIIESIQKTYEVVKQN